MCSIWCHSSGRRRLLRLVCNTFPPSPGPRSFSPHFCLRGRLGNLLCAGAHGVESAVVGVGGGVPPPTRLKATLIYLIIFQEVTYFVGRAGRGCGGSSPAHQLLLDRPTMVALHWSSWPSSRPRFCRAPWVHRVWSLFSWQHFRRYLCVTACSPNPKKVRAEEEVPTLVKLLRSSVGFGAIICPLWPHRDMWIIASWLKCDTLVHLYALILRMEHWATNCAQHAEVFWVVTASGKLFKCLVPAWITSQFQPITEVTLFVWSESGRKPHFGGGGGLPHTHFRCDVRAWSSPFGPGLMTSQSQV